MNGLPLPKVAVCEKMNNICKWNNIRKILEI